MPPKTPGKRPQFGTPQTTHSFKNAATAPRNHHRSSLKNQLLKGKATPAAVSPEEPGGAPATPFASPFGDEPRVAKAPTPGAPASDEDAAFMNLLEKRSKRGCCYACGQCLTFPCRIIYNILHFLALLTFQVLFLIYSYTLWECCGIPVSKLNREDYLFSKYARLLLTRTHAPQLTQTRRYLGMSGEITVFFALVKMDREEQLKWIECWAATDKNGDDQMDTKEFHQFFGLADTECWLTERLFNM